MLRCPVEDTGRNSVMPSTMPRRMACSQFKGTPGVDGWWTHGRLPAHGVGKRPGHCGTRRSGGGSAARRHRGKGPTLWPHISLCPFYNVGGVTSPARATSACGRGVAVGGCDSLHDEVCCVLAQVLAQIGGGEVDLAIAGSLDDSGGEQPVAVDRHVVDGAVHAFGDVGYL